jgi:hypothetical protein
MSEATKEALDRAVEAHLASECGDELVQLTGYILQSVGSSVKTDMEPLVYCGLSGQSGVVTLGLLQYMQYNAEGVTFEGGDDDE